MANRFEILYRPGIKEWLSVGDLREAMQVSLSYAKPLTIVANLSSKTQLALLKFAEECYVPVSVATSHRLSREVETRATSIVGRCGQYLDPVLIGIAMFDGKAASELTWLLGAHDLSTSGRGRSVEALGSESGDGDLAEEGDDMV